MISRRAALLGLSAAWAQPNLRVVRHRRSGAKTSEPLSLCSPAKSTAALDAFERELNKGAKRQS
jgi:hypothetical protein